MNIKGSFGKVSSQMVWELATHVIDYNTTIIRTNKEKIYETQTAFEARPWYYRAAFDYPRCYEEQWKIGNAEDAIDHATNLVRICVNTTDDIFLSPQDAAFIGLNSENENNS